LGILLLFDDNTCVVIQTTFIEQ